MFAQFIFVAAVQKLPKCSSATNFASSLGNKFIRPLSGCTELRKTTSSAWWPTVIKKYLLTKTLLYNKGVCNVRAAFFSWRPGARSS